MGCVVVVLVWCGSRWWGGVWRWCDVRRWGGSVGGVVRVFEHSFGVRDEGSRCTGGGVAKPSSPPATGDQAFSLKTRVQIITKTRRIKWERAAAMAVVLLLGLWLAFGPGSQLDGAVKLAVLLGSALAALAAAVILRRRNTVYRRLVEAEDLDSDADGVPDVYSQG